MSLEFAGRVVLVTGGGRGIGWACAEAFAQQGASVALTWNRDGETAGAAAQALRDGGVMAEALELRLGDRASARECVAGVLERFGRLDVLVNNAGVWNTDAKGADELTDDDLGSMIDVNLKGAMQMAGAVLPGMAAQRYGRIISVGSTAGVRGEAGHSHYAASKGALTAWTRSLAVEWGPRGITANVVAPGWVYTDMTRSVLSPAMVQHIEASIPTGRLTRSDDVAAAVLFLASDRAGQITGAHLDVNGGAVFS